MFYVFVSSVYLLKKCIKHKDSCVMQCICVEKYNIASLLLVYSYFKSYSNKRLHAKVRPDKTVLLRKQSEAVMASGCHGEGGRT